MSCVCVYVCDVSDEAKEAARAGIGALQVSTLEQHRSREKYLAGQVKPKSNSSDSEDEDDSDVSDDDSMAEGSESESEDEKVNSQALQKQVKQIVSNLEEGSENEDSEGSENEEKEAGLDDFSALDPNVNQSK